MKKSLSLLVAIAMVFSMFAAVASAAEETKLTTEQKYEELVKAGLFEGYPDGEAHLDKEMTRAQASKIVALLTGYSEGVEVKDAGYTDLVGAGWATDFINYATQVGILEGKGNNKFDPSAQVTVQQLATIAVKLAKHADVTVPAGEEVEGKVDAWAADAVASAIAAGLLAKQDDYTVNANRGVLVEVVYSAKQIVEQVSDVTATQTGVKQVTVKFNKAIDADKAKFAVKNGNAKRDVDSADFAADKKSVVINLTAKLLDGASSVTVSGVADKDLVAEFAAQAEKVTEIKFGSDKLAIGTKNDGSADLTKVSTSYKILNQFGEDVTKSAGGSLSFQVGKPSTTPSASNGILELTSTGFVYGETIYVTAILNMGTYGVTANQAFTVSQQAYVDSVKIESLYHPENKELMTNSTFPDFVLLVEAKDQYGNDVNLAQFQRGVFALAQNPTLFTIDIADAVDGQGPEFNKIGLPLTAPQSTFVVAEGANKVTLTTLFGQKSDSIEVPVKKASTLTTFTLQQPEEQVSAGSTVKIPFVAYDQDGKELKKYADIKPKVQLSASNGNDTISIEQNYVTKEAYIEWTAPAQEGVQFLSSNIIGTPSNSQQQITVVAAGKADSVAGLKDVSLALVKGGSVKIEPKHIVIKDQFGRNMDTAVLLDSGDYEIYIEAAGVNTGAVTGFGDFAASTDSVTLSGANKGTQRIKIELYDLVNSKTVSTHESSVVSVVDNSGIQSGSYAIVLADKISDQSKTVADYKVGLKVTAKNSSGKEVTLPASDYSVTTTANLDFTANKLGYAGTDPVEQGKTVNGVVKVTILANGETVSKDVVVSGDASVVTTLAVEDAAPLKAKDQVVQGTAANVTNIANVFATVVAKDQYGVAFKSAANFTATITQPDGVTVVTASGDIADVEISGVDAGDSYYVTFSAKDTLKDIKVRVVATTN